MLKVPHYTKSFTLKDTSSRDGDLNVIAQWLKQRTCETQTMLSNLPGAFEYFYWITFLLLKIAQFFAYLNNILLIHLAIYHNQVILDWSEKVFQAVLNHHMLFFSKKTLTRNSFGSDIEFTFYHIYRRIRCKVCRLFSLS